jgi:hypothetical protein
MTDEMPDGAVEVFKSHDAYERTDEGFAVTTTTFGGTVTAADRDGPKLDYTVTVRAPTIEAATADVVGETVALDWFETLARRLEAAPTATRRAVDLDSCVVEREGGEVRVEYAFAWGNPSGAADIAKTFVEYVEGTYVEGIVPGYEYESPVADLLASASQSGESGTPL